MSGALPRQVVVDSIHQGIAKAVRRFETWTYGESLSWYGVENVLSVYAAETIGENILRLKTNHSLTMEQNFREILTYSKRKNRTGRPSFRYKSLRESDSKRIDIVIWNNKAEPKAIIEIKRNSTISGLLDDAERVLSFLEFCGKEYSGSVKYGFVASVLEADTPNRMRRKIDARKNKFEEQYANAVANLRMHETQNIARRDRASRRAKSENLFSSIIFEFAAKR